MAKSSSEAYGAEGRTNALFFDPEKLVLVTDKASPLYDERVNLPISESMVLNIMHHGVIQPITVRKNPETGLTEVVTGRQRVKNAREANKRLAAQGLKTVLVPATVRPGDDGGLAGVMVSENEIREDDTPMGRAKKMQRLMGFGHDEASLTVIFGCSGQTVRNNLALLDCCADVRKAVDAGKINVSHARALSKLEPEEQRDKLALLVEAGDGVQGHEKTKKQREALGEAKPKVRSRKDIQAAIDDPKEEFATWRDALLWALGAEAK